MSDQSVGMMRRDNAAYRALISEQERTIATLRTALVFFASRSTWWTPNQSGYTVRVAQPWRVATKALGWDDYLKGAAAPKNFTLPEETP